MYEIFLKLLNKAGLRAADVSRATGIPSGVLSDWKKGRYRPKDDKRRKIAEYLGVSLEYLDTGIAEEKKSDSGKKYYFNDETALLAEDLYQNPAKRVLMDSVSKLQPEHVEMIAELAEKLRRSYKE